MAGLEHTRVKIFSKNQHPLRHDLSDFQYLHPALPVGFSTLDAALGYLFDTAFPQMKTNVADVASLPLIGNTINDKRIVNDDGDGKSAMYIWTMYDGDGAATWHKIADIDWGMSQVLAELEWRTQPW